MREGDSLPLGAHTLQFYFAPMVHWPEVMLAFEESQGILFAADAFGSFGAHDGDIFSDEKDFERIYLSEARRYYANIVGKYGPQVQATLKKLGGVDVKMICPLHGPVWREDLGYILDKYDRWSKYIPEEPGVVLAYASMYGNTENAVDLLAGKLAQRGIANLSVFDVSKTHPSEIIAEMFRLSHMVLASPTYNMGIYYGMHGLLHEMAALNLQNRKVAIIGNGSWAPAAANLMKKQVEGMKNMALVCEPLEIRSALKKEQMPDVDAMVDAICASMEAV